MAETPNKLVACDYAAVRSWVKLPEGAAALIEECRAAPDAVTLLERRGFLIEAVELTAHALPKPESVWWACMCADHTAPLKIPEEDRLAREAAEAWVRFNTDLLRRQAMDRAEASGMRTPEAWAAVAAFWSDGSLAPLGKPMVPPGPNLTGKAVLAAMRLASARDYPKREHVRLRRFLDSARAIADGESGRLPQEAAEMTVSKRPAEPRG